MSSEKIQGTVKWFSNQKGYGFITPDPGSSNTEDIFVHQSTIHSDGYRTLGEGWIVEYEIGRDEDGKMKAENVTAPGGGPCTGPRHPRRGKRTSGGNKEEDGNEEKGDDEPKQEVEGDDGGKKRGHRKNADKKRGPPQPVWHDTLSDEVKTNLADKQIRTATGTIDIALGSARIKLGTRGYASMAHADAVLAEGSFSVSDSKKGLVIFEWKRALMFVDGVWTAHGDMSSLVSQVTLSDDAVGAVGVDENMASLMGDAPTDPKSALEEHGFEMRRVVLTAKRR